MLATIAALVVICVHCMVAQPWRGGAELTGSMLMPRSTLSELPSFPTCCQTLNPTSGWALGLRGVLVRDVAPALSLEAQLGISYGQLRLARTESIGFALDGTDNQATVITTLTETSLALALGSVETRLLAAWAPLSSAPGLHFAGGVGGYLPLYARLRQAEQLLSPTTAVFSDTRTRERLTVDTTVASVVSSWLSAQIGVGVYLPMSDNIDLRARLMVELPLSSLAGDGTRVLSLGGVRLDLLAMWKSIPKPVQMDTQHIDNPIPVSRPLAVTTNLIAMAPSPAGTIVVRIDEQFDVDIHALLPFVFFDVGSAQIPERYAGNVDPSTFHERAVVYQKRAEQASVADRTLAVYYHILDIVGRRLRDEYPSARLTVAGYVDDQGVETGNVRLAKRRAETVVQYLTSRWQIASERISIVSGIRSPTAAVTSMPDVQDRRDGYEENRRVELSSTIAAVLDPVVVADTTRVMTLPPMSSSVIATDVRGATLKTWWNTDQDSVRQVLQADVGDVDDWLEAGEGPHLQRIDVRFSDPLQRVRRVQYNALVRRQADSAFASSVLPVRYDVQARRRYSGDADSTESRFMLTQFEYGTGRMLAVQSSIIDRYINPEITPRTSITITGFTDRKGDATRNAELSILRAREASATIAGGAKRAILGEGEAGSSARPPFVNQLPETRLYNRTVEILLRTPIR